MRQPWIRNYINGLIADPPSGTYVTVATNGRYRGIRIRGGPIPVDLWVHDDYIRVGVHKTTDVGLHDRLRSFAGFDIRRQASRWLTGYVRTARGLDAVNWLIRHR